MDRSVWTQYDCSLRVGKVWTLTGEPGVEIRTAKYGRSLRAGTVLGLVIKRLLEYFPFPSVLAQSADLRRPQCTALPELKH